MYAIRSYYANSGFMFMRLKPRSERKLNADQIIQRLRPKVMQVPGIMMFLQNPPPIRLEASLSKAQYQFALQSPDTEELYRNAELLEGKLRQLPLLQDVTSDLQLKNPRITSYNVCYTKLLRSLTLFRGPYLPGYKVASSQAEPPDL